MAPGPSIPGSRQRRKDSPLCKGSVVLRPLADETTDVIVVMMSKTSILLTLVLILTFVGASLRHTATTRLQLYRRTIEHIHTRCSQKLRHKSATQFVNVVTMAALSTAWAE